MLKLLKAFLFLLLLPAGTQAQFENAFDTPQPRRIQELANVRSKHFLKADPAVQIMTYTQLKEMAEKHRDPQSVIYAKACLAHVEVRLDSSKLKDFTNKMTGLIQHSMDTENEILQAHLLMMLVEDLGFLGRRGAALSYFILADDIMNRLGHDETPRNLQGSKYDLIMHLYEIGDYRRAKEIMDRSAWVIKHPVWEFFFVDLHSQILLQLHQFDSSAYYIQIAKAILDNDTSEVFNKGWHGILEGNLAKIHYYKKEFALAIPSLKKAVEITNKSQLYDNTAAFGLLLAKCYIELHEVDSVQSLMPVIRHAVYGQNKDEHYIDLYKLMLVIPDDNLAPERSLQLFDSIDIRRESLAQLNDRNLLTKNEMEDELKTYHERQDLMTAEIKKQLRWRNLLWICLGCAVIVSLYVFNKGNKRIRLEQDRSRLIQEHAEHELSAAREQLQFYITSLQEKSHQIELLENNIDVSDQNETLEQLRRNTILTDEEWTNFKSLFEKAQPGFFARVKDKFPNLTPGEMRFLAFVKLNFTTKEMASTLGVSPVSVRSIRSRLLKKLHLAENENLGQLVRAI